MESDPRLDNVIWTALTTHQAHLALGGALARRFPPSFTPFVASADFSAASYDAMAQLVVPDEEVVMFTPVEVRPSAAMEVTGSRRLLQMVNKVLPAKPERPDFVTLSAADSLEMRALAEETKPGPFSTRTHELGDFAGVRVDGELAAMAGERMHLTGYREVTAVCVRPAYRGRGYARGLVLTIAHGIRARGETPMLHVFSDNYPAIALYESLGFRPRAELWVTKLRRAP